MIAGDQWALKKLVGHGYVVTFRVARNDIFVLALPMRKTLKNVGSLPTSDV